MKITKSQLKELIKQAIVEDIMDKEILNPKTKNKIKVRTALQLPDEHPANKKAKDMVAKTSIAKGDVGGPAYPNVPKKKKGKSVFDKDKPAFKKPSDMGSGQGMMKTGYDEPTAADDVESNWDKSSKEFESLEDKHGVRIDDQSDWSGIENNPRGEYSVSGKNSEDPGDGFSIYSTVETGEDGESYEGNKNIITFPQDDDPFGGQVELEFDSIGDAKETLDKILGDKKIKSALDGGRADMANNKDYIKKQVEKLGGKTIRESIKESKKRRYTVKEVRMWMKKLEENRYKKVYNSDARIVAWLGNNEGKTLDEMPMSMKKKWSKAQYGRERYLATEFIKSKSEQMNEGKLTEVKQGYVVADIYGGVYTKKAVSEKKALAMLNKMAHFGGDKIFMIGVEAWNKPHKMNKKKIMVKEQKLREQIREIIKEQLNEKKETNFQMNTRDMREVDKLLKKGKFKGLKMKAKGPKFILTVPKKMEDKVLSYLIQKNVKNINEV